MTSSSVPSTPISSNGFTFSASGHNLHQHDDGHSYRRISEPGAYGGSPKPNPRHNGLVSHGDWAAN